MYRLTPITVPKKARSTASTMPPVSGLGRSERLAIGGLSLVLRADEIVGGGRDDAETDIGDEEFDGDRLVRIVLGRRGDQEAQLFGPVAADHDHRTIRRDRIGADD